MIISKKEVNSMKEKGTVVVFGGSFNPPHNFHFFTAQQVLNQYEEVEKIIFIPVNKKYVKDGLVANEHRYNMLKLVTDKNEKFEVSDMDMHKDRSLYTIETLEEIQNQYKDKNVWFLIGSDNLKELHTWKRAEELLVKYKVLVMERDNDNIADIIENNVFFKKHKENIYKLNNEIKNNFSSTYIRTQLNNKKSVRYLLPDEVYEYIKENRLYSKTF